MNPIQTTLQHEKKKQSKILCDRSDTADVRVEGREEEADSFYRDQGAQLCFIRFWLPQ